VTAFSRTKLRRRSMSQEAGTPSENACHG
jgi:hypothetical protein